jgi:4-amino-4-deoxy-L-arabinose transferase-like glycosyltransferase
MQASSSDVPSLKSPINPAKRQRRSRSSKAGSAKTTFRVSLVLPAWNEQATIRKAMREADRALSALGAEYEILVVDDGSSDDTADLVRAEALKNPRVRLVQHATNRGYGAALRTGFQEAALDLVAFTDADCQFDLRDLEYVLPLARRYDVVCGYRIDRQDPAYRRFLSQGYNALVAVLVGSPVRDVDCALKVFRRERLESILPECDNFFVNTEVLSRARLEGLRIVEVGVRHRPRAAGASKVSWRDVPRTLSALLPFWWSRLLFAGASSKGATWDARCWVALVALALLAGGLLLPGLSYPLVEPDESRYAEIAREMQTTGDWIMPTLNRQNYIDKPPLLYWLVAGSFGFFGTSEWAARLVPAVSALATVLATFVFGSRLVGRRAAFLSACALALMPGFAICGRFLVLDSLLAWWVTAALFAGYRAIQGSRVFAGWWVISAACCGLGVLTKGPVAVVLVVPVLAAHLWLTRHPTRPTLAHWLTYGAMNCGLAAPWYLAITARDPAFAWHFLIDHHLARFFGSEYHAQPFWYYIPIIAAACLPWSVLLVPIFRFLLDRSPETRTRRSPALGFFVLWAGWCLLFFSLSQGKLPTYVLPALPPVAVLIGYYLQHVLSERAPAPSSQWAYYTAPRLGALLLCSVWLVASVVGYYLQLLGPVETLAHAALAAGGVTAAWLWGYRMAGMPAFVVWGALVAGGILGLAHGLVPAWAGRRSPLAQSKAIPRTIADGVTPVVCYGGEWWSVPFYLQSRDKVASFSEDAPEQLRQYFRQHSRCLVVLLHQKDLTTFQHELRPDSHVLTVSDVGEARTVLVQTGDATDSSHVR